jgi:hypothetical protein
MDNAALLLSFVTSPDGDTVNIKLDLQKMG